jgi:hypothetical protein
MEVVVSTALNPDSGMRLGDENSGRTVFRKPPDVAYVRTLAWPQRPCFDNPWGHPQSWEPESSRTRDDCTYSIHFAVWIVCVTIFAVRKSKVNGRTPELLITERQDYWARPSLASGGFAEPQTFNRLPNLGDSQIYGRHDGTYYKTAPLNATVSRKSLRPQRAQYTSRQPTISNKTLRPASFVP